MIKKEKNKSGRPVLSLNEEQVKEVEELAGKLTRTQIADYFGINPDTFNEIKKRQPEINRAYKKGRSNAVKAVAKSLFEKAIGGDTAAAAFYLKTQARWSEKHRNKLTLNFSKEKTPLDIIDTALISLEKGKITPQEASQIGGLANLKANIESGMPSPENTNVREGREELKKLLAGLDKLEQKHEESK